MSTVLTCWRYPVKSAAAEPLSQLTLTADGVAGDRAWAVVDADDLVVSAKHPRKGGRLLQVAAHYQEPSGEVSVSVPGHPSHPAGDPAADVAISSWLGRPVTLTEKVRDGLRLHRLWPQEPGMLPDWAQAAPGEHVVTEVAGTGRGRFVDYGPVHLVTAGALARLEARLGRPVEAARFRPNLVLDLAADPKPGEVLVIGDVELVVDLPTPRCVLPSLVQPGLDGPDPALLGVLARYHREPVGSRGRAAVFGCYADVRRPGRIRIGDPVRVVDAG